jgi:hypothetical protein
MSKHLTLHLINHQLKVWEKVLPEVHQSDKVWFAFVLGKIKKLKSKKQTYLCRKKPQKLGVQYTNKKETNFSIDKEIKKWYERNETIETM